MKSVVQYLENQYAQQVWAPKEFKRGRNGFVPSRPVLGHFDASYAHECLDTVT
jgi:hypothetical protein